MQVTPTNIVLWTSAWSAIGWLAGHRLTIGRDCRNRKSSFVGLIASLISETEQTSLLKLDDLRKSAIPKVAGQCAEVEGHISLCNRKRFVIARDKFCALKRSDLMDMEREKRRTVYDSSPPNFELGRQCMKELLKELIWCAK